MGFWSELATGFTKKVTVDQLHNFSFMCAEPLNRLYPSLRWAERPDQITVTVVNRLCHMIHRMERAPTDFIGGAARWYTSNLALAPILDAERKFVDGLCDRLMAAVHEHEKRRGQYEGREGFYCDPADFGRMVGTSDRDKKYVLFGPPMVDDNGHQAAYNTPVGMLAYAIRDLWRCGYGG